ncbi:MAG: hypothetical protein L6R41_002420 [Letrouitia leprolyta]|nr:MAG: hypothetical protein L6R41_002420 [Letrouitia leprolyta]
MRYPLFPPSEADLHIRPPKLGLHQGLDELKGESSYGPLQPAAMLPAITWRPLAAAFTISCIVVYTWLGKLVPNLNDYQDFQAQKFSGHGSLSHQSLQPIPKKIWQINFNHPRYFSLEKFVGTWRDQNPDYEHTLLDKEAGEDIVRKLYGDNSEPMKTYLELGSTIFRADYLRYLVLAAEGGFYSDLDTHIVKPIDEWYEESADQPVRALVGMEYDQRGDPTLVDGMYMPVQFCQWTLATSAHHPLMVSMVESVTQGIQNLARTHESALSDLRPTNEEVLHTTGPVKWTREVFAHLSETTGTEVTHLNLTGLQEPKMFGDVLVLPINSFASGLGHSGSSGVATDQTLMWHTFQGAWKAGGAGTRSDWR